MQTDIGNHVAGDAINVEIFEKFEKGKRSYIYRDLLGFDMTTNEGRTMQGRMDCL